MKAKITIKPHVGAMAYTVLAGTLYVGRIIEEFGSDYWLLLAFSAHPEEADKEDDELDRIGFNRSRLAMCSNNLNVCYASYEAVPATLDRHNAESIVVTAFDKELARVNILDPEYGYKFAVDSACTIRDQFNKDWMRKLERNIVRAYYNKSSNSNKATGE